MSKMEETEMEKPEEINQKTSAEIVKRLLKLSVIAIVIILIIVFLVTKSLFYSIIFLLGSIISLSGFLVMIRMTDRVLRQGKGQLFFFLVMTLKLGVIAGVFYLVSRSAGDNADGAAIWFLTGLSVIVIALAMEGVYLVYRSVSNART